MASDFPQALQNESSSEFAAPQNWQKTVDAMN
jgi:hypothetical protein